jgi:hypothetical protein
VAYGFDNEYDLLELPSGKIIAVLRDWRSPHEGHGKSLLYWAKSDDGGKTWTTPRPAMQTMVGHAPCLFMTKKRRLICSYRYTGELERGLMGVAFSYGTDDGTQWGGQELVWMGAGWSGYLSIAYADEDRILIVYWMTWSYGLEYPQRVPADLKGVFYVEED